MTALLAYSFLVAAVLVRVAIHQKRTGNHGIRLANPCNDPVAAVAGGIFVLSFLASLVLITLNLLGALPSTRPPAPWIEHVGLGIGFLGIGIVVIAQAQMHSAWRIGVDPNEITDLVTHGLYRRSRNPIYFGILLFWLGILATYPYIPLALLAGLSWFGVELIVRKVEEPHLKKLHGAAYLSYVERTYRYRLF